MSRKDYVALAAALAATRPSREWLNKHQQWARDVEIVASALARDNARFDRARFLAACEAID